MITISRKKLIATSVLIILVIIIPMSFYTFAAAQPTYHYSYQSMPQLNIYSDKACTIPITNMQWGQLTPGATITKTIYVKNTQGLTTLTLSLVTANWSPSSANGPITITWNKQGTKLAPMQSTQAIITLKISSSILKITSFGVQISVTGS
jgi:hypothetical protein